MMYAPFREWLKAPENDPQDSPWTSVIMNSDAKHTPSQSCETKTHQSTTDILEPLSVVLVRESLEPAPTFVLVHLRRHQTHSVIRLTHRNGDLLQHHHSEPLFFIRRDDYEDIAPRMKVNELRARQRMNQRMVHDEHLTIEHEAIVMLFHQNHKLHQAVPKLPTSCSKRNQQRRVGIVNAI